MVWICIDFNADPDPDLNPDLGLDPDPDPDSQTNADPDPDPRQTFKSQKVKFLDENILKLSNRAKKVTRTT